MGDVKEEEQQVESEQSSLDSQLSDYDIIDDVENNRIIHAPAKNSFSEERKRVLIKSSTTSIFGRRSTNTVPPMLKLEEGQGEPVDITNVRILESLKDSINFSMEVSAVELWTLDHTRTKLQRDGHFVNTELCSTEISLLMNEETSQIEPGSGLAGLLWAQEDSSYHQHGPRRRTLSEGTENSSRGKMFATFGTLLSPKSSLRGNMLFQDSTKHNSNSQLNWIDLCPLSIDPDTQDERLDTLVKSGIAYAAGVSFDFLSHYHFNQENRCKGIVIYYAHKDADRSLLMDGINSLYLKNSVQHIGATLALAESRRACLDAKDATLFIQKHIKSQMEQHQNQLEKERKQSSSCASMFLRKIFHPNLTSKPPPSMSWRESLWTFLCCLITMGSVSMIRNLFQIIDRNYDIVLGPIGALMALQFSLTASPTSQPRNIFYGTLVASCITLSSTSILRSPWLQIPSWLSVSITTSTSVAAMSKLGIVHPPAAGLAVVLSLTYCEANDDGNSFCTDGWINMGLYMCANVIAVFCSVILNNMNEKRQYPHYWKLLPCSHRS